MGRETKPRASEDIWHLDIEDLLGTPTQPERGAGSGPFVINLRTSATRIGPPPSGLPRYERLHIYQLERSLDGRAQFRLRIGIIESEIEADSILAAVREIYPGAFSEIAEDDDRTEVARHAPIPVPVKPPIEKAAAQADSARPASPPANRAPPASPPAPAAAPAPPVEEFRWDIDELLPDLGGARTASTSRKVAATVAAPPAAARMAPESTPPAAVRIAPEAPPSVPRVVPAPPLPAAAPRQALVATPPTAVAPRVSPPARPSPVVKPPNAAPVMRHAPRHQPLPAAGPVMARPPTDSRSSAPESPSRSLRADRRADHDPDAVTDEVQIPAFTVEIPAAEAPVEEPIELLEIAIDTTVTELSEVEVMPIAVLPKASAPAPARVFALEPTPVREVAPRAPTPPPPPKPNAAAPRPLPAPMRAGSRVIDSTQTVRALTPLELADDQISRWFAIQLSLSERPVDPENVPDLPIFNEYRLYSVTGTDQDRVMHALRLGFFSSESAAQAVAGFVAKFFDSPCIKRVSTAEHDRFEERRVAAGKDVGAGGHAVIELAGPAPLPERPMPERPVATKPEDDDVSGEPGTPSLWARLLRR